MGLILGEEGAGTLGTAADGTGSRHLAGEEVGLRKGAGVGPHREAGGGGGGGGRREVAGL
jgi:hypothetical protein